MKYAMVVMRDRERFRPAGRQQREFETTAEWWAGLRARVLTQARLGSDDDIVSVTWDGAEPLVTDGPYVEAKESVGGILILDVDSREEAIALAKAVPPRAGLRIEVRQILEP